MKKVAIEKADDQKEEKEVEPVAVTAAEEALDAQENSLSPEERASINKEVLQHERRYIKILVYPENLDEARDVAWRAHSNGVAR